MQNAASTPYGGFRRWKEEFDTRIKEGRRDVAKLEGKTRELGRETNDLRKETKKVRGETKELRGQLEAMSEDLDYLATKNMEVVDLARAEARAERKKMKEKMKETTAALAAKIETLENVNVKNAATQKLAPLPIRLVMTESGQMFARLCR